MTRSPLKRSRRPIRKVSEAARARKDEAYYDWLLTEPSIVSLQKAVPLLTFNDRLIIDNMSQTAIERHHSTTPHRDSHAVPLYWWLHRLTSISVHGGGGNRAFEERFNVDFGVEAARLRAKYEAETGMKVRG